MGQISLPNLDDVLQQKDQKKQIEALVNTVGMLIKNLSELNGYINSKNIFEAGGWRVTNTDLISKDYDVGMSTDDIGANPVRFWAGGLDKDTAPFRVHQDGSGVATGWTLQSKGATYPRVVLDASGDFFGAYKSPSDYALLEAFGTSGSPAMTFHSGGSRGGMFLNPDANLDIYSLGRMTLTGFPIVIAGGSQLYSGTGDFSWIETFGTNLQAELDSLRYDLDNHSHVITIPTHTHTVSGSTAQAGGGGTFTTS